MRKKAFTLMFGLMLGTAVVGCGNSQPKTVSNDNITVKGYNQLEVQKVEEIAVTDEDVTSQIQTTLEYSTEYKEVDRAAKNGDVVNIDYIGKIKGKAFDGGTAEGADLELGSNTYIGAQGDYKGFEEQIVGHKKGDEFDIEVKFPDDYQSEDLAGKAATFTIKLNKVQVTEVPELTDEWVQNNSETSKTVDEYKAEIKKQMEESNKEQQENELKEAVMQALKDVIEIKKLPEDDMKEIQDEISDYYKSMAESYGMEYADFISQYAGMTEEDFAEEIKKIAENSESIMLACQLIADQEKLNPTEDEYNKRIEEYAEEYNCESAEEFLEQYGEDNVKKTILQDKVIEYLVEHAKQVETEAATTQQ